MNLNFESQYSEKGSETSFTSGNYLNQDLFQAFNQTQNTSQFTSGPLFGDCPPIIEEEDSATPFFQNIPQEDQPTQQFLQNTSMFPKGETSQDFENSQNTQESFFSPTPYCERKKKSGIINEKNLSTLENSPDFMLQQSKLGQKFSKEEEKRESKNKSFLQNNQNRNQMAAIQSPDYNVVSQQSFGFTEMEGGNDESQSQTIGIRDDIAPPDLSSLISMDETEEQSRFVQEHTKKRMFSRHALEQIGDNNEEYYNKAKRQKNEERPKAHGDGLGSKQKKVVVGPDTESRHKHKPTNKENQTPSVSHKIPTRRSEHKQKKQNSGANKPHPHPTHPTHPTHDTHNTHNTHNTNNTNNTYNAHNTHNSSQNIPNPQNAQKTQNSNSKSLKAHFFIQIYHFFIYFAVFFC